MTTTIRRECLAGYDEGLLKSLLDGQLAPAWQEQLRSHAAGCVACGVRLAQLRSDGALVQGRLLMLGGAPSAAAALANDYPELPARPAVATVLARARAARGAAPRAGGWSERISALAGRWSQPAFGSLRPLPLAGGAAAAALLLGVSFTQPAVQSFAQGIVQSLRVQQVQPVKVDLSFLRGLPVHDRDDLSRLGTFSGATEPKVRATNLADAARTTGLQLRAPTALPAQLAQSRMIYVGEAANFSFTYDGQKLVTAAQGYGISDAALLNELRALNGQTVKGSVPASSAFIYGTPPMGDGSAGGAARQSATQRPSSPYVAFLQLKSPTLDVPPTINVDRLRDVLLKSGAVPPALASQLLAIQDWRTTLPIPVTRGTSSQVQVDGVSATLITGELPVPALVWQKDGTLHALVGSLSEADLLAAARSLQPAR